MWSSKGGRIMIINMTPHDINLMKCIEDGHWRPVETIPKSGKTIRLNEAITVVGEVISKSIEYQILHYNYSGGDELPIQKEGVRYIVSAMVANAHPERTDFLMVAKTVRNDEGRIIGCEAFAVATMEDEEE
jgi:hypothetical protein